MEVKKIIIIPDVHGRTFWKEPVMKYKNDPEVHIVFLGDYLDAYESLEHITAEDAIVNFEEIIDIAKSANNITLLLGNHDLHYFPKLLDCWGCRRYNQYKHDISNMFMSNKELFSLAYDVDIKGKKYMFTHAGILEDWFKFITGKIESKRQDGKTWMDFYNLSDESKNKLKSITLDAKSINSLLTFDDGFYCTWMISRSRGGRDYAASFLWADIHDHFDAQFWNKESTWYKDMYQIFSHTFSYLSLDEYYLGEDFAMLDCRKAFELDCETQKIYEFV